MSDPSTILHDPSAALDLIEARAQAATEGPWKHNGVNGVHTRVGSCVALSYRHDDDNRRADATFIAHAREDVPWLVDLARRQDAALRAVLAELDRADAKPGPDGERQVHTVVIRQAITTTLSAVIR